ncbi:hypothetical protein NQ318_017122 [Aromia moschata]|uniref:Uncharacterized protein n=1 Tax=Aromia moschata TaxID=1265417 RepID=A0AAV8XGH6_9CUCU|nr:hypothetical protein NQ318_017122 [Aromia moschata]
MIFPLGTFFVELSTSKSEFGESDLNRRNIKDLNFHVYGQRQKNLSFQDRGKRLKLQQFVIRKASPIFSLEATPSNVAQEGTITEDIKALDHKNENYDTVLEKSIGFNNPNNIQYLSEVMDINKHFSFMSGLNGRFPENEYANELRQVQASKWAYRNVAEGIDHFKAGKHVEAFHYEEENKIEEARKAYQSCLSIIPYHEEAQHSLEFLKNKAQQAKNLIEPTEAFLAETKGDSDYEEKVRKFLEESAKWKKGKGDEKKKKKKKDKKSKKESKKKKKKDKLKRKSGFELSELDDHKKLRDAIKKELSKEKRSKRHSVPSDEEEYFLQKSGYSKRWLLRQSPWKETLIEKKKNHKRSDSRSPKRRSRWTQKKDKGSST